MKKNQIALSLAGLCYAASLFFGVFVLEESGPSTFVLGFVCLFFGWEHVAWYANPALFAAAFCHLTGRHRLAVALAAAALTLALFTFQVDEAPANEGGSKEPIVGYQPGFYLWMASIVLVLGTSLAGSIGPSRSRTAGSPPVSSG